MILVDGLMHSDMFNASFERKIDEHVHGRLTSVSVIVMIIRILSSQK